MITTDQLTEYLTQLGVSVPSFMLQAIVDKANSVQACLDGAGYSDADKLLIKMYAAAIMANDTGGRRVKSQSAPSGASQTYEYSSMLNNDLRSKLSQLDTSGCTSSLISSGTGAFLMVLK